MQQAVEEQSLVSTNYFRLSTLARKRRVPCNKMVSVNTSTVVLAVAFILLIPFNILFVEAFPEQGKWSGVLNESEVRSLFIILFVIVDFD